MCYSAFACFWTKSPCKSVFDKETICKKEVSSSGLIFSPFNTRSIGLLFLALFFIPLSAFSQRQMERLDRGVIAVRANAAEAYISWRLLGTDAEDIAFNIYRSVDNEVPQKLNDSPISQTTDYIDTPSFQASNTYYIHGVINGVELPDEDSGYKLENNAPIQQYLTIPLSKPGGGTTPDGNTYEYTANDCSVGDLDGDGDYEIIVKWDPTNSKDNSQSGYTGPTLLDAYTLKGVHLWRINLGPNIRSGAHYMDFMVYDFDGDGRAEMMCRTAPGSMDSSGGYIGGIAKWQGGTHPTFNNTDDYRNSSGYILQGPEFLTVFDGLRGTELATTRYYPQRDPDNLNDNPSSSRMNAIWGDSYGNRIDRFLAGVAYFDGRRPSAVFCRGYYTCATMAAWDWRDGQLTRRWTFDSNDGNPANLAYRGQGAHSISIGDLDGDGRDEISYGAAAIDDDGTGLWSTGLGHGDATHLSDMDPDREGLEFFMPHEDPGSYGPYASSMFSTPTGLIAWGVPGTGDIGRGVAFDIDPNYPGYEAWATNSGSVYTCKGDAIPGSSRPSVNFGVWWDGDLLRELLDKTYIDKWNPSSKSPYRLFTASGVSSNNSTKATPNLCGDILGDWREEVVWRTSDDTALRIYTTTIPATNRLTTLMHDPQYREAIAWQNTGYNQPPHPGFFLGYDMPTPPRAPIWNGDLIWSGGVASNGWNNSEANFQKTNDGSPEVFADGQSVLFDQTGSIDAPIVIGTNISPSKVVVQNIRDHDYVFTGEGSLSGSMRLTKSGLGKMTLYGQHEYSGETRVNQGLLILNGTLTASPVLVQGLGGLGGSGTLTAGLEVEARGKISPGSGIHSSGTLSVSGNASLNRSILEMDLGATETDANDMIVVSGNLTFTGQTTLHLHTLSDPAPGRYVLLSASGSLNIDTNAIQISGLTGLPYELDVTTSEMAVIVKETRASASVVWNGGSGGDWDLVGAFNWLKNGISDQFVTGDNVSFTDASVNTSATVNLMGDLAPASMIINSTKKYVLTGNGRIVGDTGLVKEGSGLLSLETNNSYTGSTVINGGTLQVSQIADGGAESSIGSSSADPGNLSIDGGLLLYSGNLSTSDRGMSVGVGGATIQVASGSASLVLNGQIKGAGSLTKVGSGSFTLGGVNTYSGGTAVRGGTLRLGSDTANKSALGSGPVNLEGGTLAMFNSTGGGSDLSSWSLVVPEGKMGRLEADGRSNLGGTLTGSGDFTFMTPYVRTDVSGDWSAFSGNLYVVSDSDGGDFRIANGKGFPNAHVDVGSQVNVYMTTSTSGRVPLGALSGETDSSFTAGVGSGAGTAYAVTWEIGSLNTDSTYAGAFNGSTNLAKVGTGEFTLSGTSTSTGSVTVEQGRLRIDGSWGTGAVTVRSGAEIAGMGSTGGNLTLDSGSVVALSLTAYGAKGISVSGNVNASGTITIKTLDQGGVLAPGAYSIISYAGSLTGTPYFVWEAPDGFTYDTSIKTDSTGQVSLVVVDPGIGRGPGDVVWSGGASSSWDASLTYNWLYQNQATPFLSGDSVFFDSTASATNVTLVGVLEPSLVTIDGSINYTFTGDGSISGATTGLIKKGSGSLSMDAVNTYGAGTYVMEGTLIGTNDTTTSDGFGAGPIYLMGGTLQMADTSGTYSGTDWDVIIPGGYTGTLRADSRTDLRGNFSGGGVLNFYTPWVRTKQQGDWSGLTGQVNVITDGDGGLFRIANLNGIPNAQVDLAARVTMLSYLNQNQTLPVGTLSGATGAELSGVFPDNNTPGAVTLTWEVGGLGGDAIFSGNVTNGKSPSIVAITKTGAGTWELAGTCSYKGMTSVRGGRLLISGTLGGTSGLTIDPGAVFELAGTCSVAGALSNSGTMVLKAGSLLSVSGTMTNDGVIDARESPNGLPASLVNNGTIILQDEIPILKLDMINGQSRVTCETQTWHTYQLQRTTDLAGDWADVGVVINGTGSQMMLVDDSPPGASRLFYRIIIGP